MNKSERDYALGQIKDYSEKFIAVIVVTAVVVAMIVSGLFSLVWVFGKLRVVHAEYRGQAHEIRMEYSGKAVLAEAAHSRLARVESAKAEKDSAILTAEAIEIVGKAAQDYPEYRQQEFYLSLGQALQDGNINQILYIPTETNLPITEAGKR